MGDSNVFDRLILRIKRAESLPMRSLKRFLGWAIDPSIPRLPGLLRPVFRFFYELHYLILVAIRLPLTVGYRGLLFQARCARFGRGVRMSGPMPFVSGHVRIEIGNHCYIGGSVSVFAGRLYETPRFVMGDRSELGWNTSIVVNREVLIEENVRIPSNCRISDSDGHPREADRRAANEPPDLKDIRPVRICRDAWIGNGTQIMKGVTIGEGAIIGANSVVIHSIPAYALAMGNPAEVIIKNFGRPSTMKKKGTPEPQEHVASLGD